MKTKMFFTGLALLCFLVKTDFAQTTIYYQDFGNSPVSVFPPGWSQTGGSTGWYMSSSSPSTGYNGYSGGLNIRAGSMSASDTLNFSGISSSGYSVISVIWAARKSTSATSTADLQWSTDAVNWQSVPYMDVQSNSAWALVNGGTLINLPLSAAGWNLLMFRWIISSVGSASIRLDDFSVFGSNSGNARKVKILSLNNGNDPDTCDQFNIIVQIQDSSGIPVNVTFPVAVSLTKFCGNGNGTLFGGQGIVLSGNSSDTIQVSYSGAETGVRLVASVSNLLPDTSSSFKVLRCNANLPTCFSWDVNGSVLDSFPSGWFSYGLVSSSSQGYSLPYSGRFDSRNDSLVICFEGIPDSAVFWLRSSLSGNFSFEILEGQNRFSNFLIEGFDTSMGHSLQSSWVKFKYSLNTSSRVLKFVLSDHSSGSVYIDSVCIYGSQSTNNIRNIKSDKINIYPNPSDCFLNVENTGDLKKINIIDLFGKNVFSTESQFNEIIEIPVGSLGSGLYIIQFENKSGKFQSLKFIKN